MGAGIQVSPTINARVLEGLVKFESEYVLKGEEGDQGTSSASTSNRRTHRFKSASTSSFSKPETVDAMLTEPEELSLCMLDYDCQG